MLAKSAWPFKTNTNIDTNKATSVIVIGTGMFVIDFKIFINKSLSFDCVLYIIPQMKKGTLKSSLHFYYFVYLSATYEAAGLSGLILAVTLSPNSAVIQPIAAFIEDSDFPLTPKSQ